MVHPATTAIKTDTPTHYIQKRLFQWVIWASELVYLRQEYVNILLRGEVQPVDSYMKIYTVTFYSINLGVLR